MVSRISSILNWNILKLLSGLCILSLIMGVEFFIGFDVIAIEKWLADHPYHLILSISLTLTLMFYFMTASVPVELKTGENNQKYSQGVGSLHIYFIFALLILTLFSLSYFSSTFTSLLKTDSFFQTDQAIIKLISISSLFFFDFQLLKNNTRKLINSSILKYCFLAILSSLISSGVMMLLFRDFSSLVVAFGINSFCYSALYALMPRARNKYFESLGCLLLVMILSYLTLEASRHELSFELGILSLFGFVLIEYLLRSSRKC